MAIFAVAVNKQMKKAFRANKARIADINSQIEDSLSGIRVVKSFGNEKVEMGKFRQGNERFVESKKVSYRFMGIFNSGMGALTTMVTIAVLVAGAVFLTDGSMEITDLITFLLYINNFTEPVKKLMNFTEQFQNGYSGYERFREMMDIEPDIADVPDAVELKDAKGEVEFRDVSSLRRMSWKKF